MYIIGEKYEKNRRKAVLLTPSFSNKTPTIKSGDELRSLCTYFFEADSKEKSFRKSGDPP